MGIIHSIRSTGQFPVHAHLGPRPLPDLTWIIGVFLLAPLFCIMAIALNVIVSSRVTDVRASQQIGSLVVLPVVLLFIVSLSGLFVMGPHNARHRGFGLTGRPGHRLSIAEDLPTRGDPCKVEMIS